MVDIKWIKLDTGIFEDEKIKIILAMPEGKTLLLVWLRLLCLAGRLNNSGVLMINNTLPYTLEMLGAIFGENHQIMQMAIDTFKGLGMIDTCNGAIYLPNWEKHQSEDALAKIRESNRLSQARHREKQKLKAGEQTVRLPSSDSNAYVSIQRVESRELEVENRTKKHIPTDDKFNAFWQAYPKHSAKADAAKAFAKLNPDDALMQTILTSIASWKKTEQWTKDNKQYVPLPATFIRGRRWEDELPKEQQHQQGNGYGLPKGYKTPISD